MKAKCGNTAIAWKKSKCSHPATGGLKLAVIFPNETFIAVIVFYCALLVHPAWWHKYEGVAPLVFIALMLGALRCGPKQQPEYPVLPSRATFRR
jgi:hypothetical protein